jgi:membrane protease YdiL (CAAX protease family)
MSVDDEELPAWMRGGVATVQAILAILIAFFAGAAIAVPGQNLVLDLGLIVADTAEAKAASSALQFLGFGVGALVYLLAVGRWDVVPGWYRRPTRRDLLWMGGGIVSLYLASVVLSTLLPLVGVEIAQNQIVELGRETPILFLYMIPVTILFVAPAEELLFRGIVQGRYREAFGPTAAVVIASLLFGLVHWLALIGTGSGRLVYVLIAALLGLFLGAAYERTKSLLVPVVIHAGYNIVGHLMNYSAAVGLF